MMESPLAADLDHVLAQTRGLWDRLRGCRLFLTGGTGFIGSWLLESLAWADTHLELGVSAVVLTRDPGAFLQKVPHLAGHPMLRLHTGDVRTCEFPEGRYAYVIHGAADASVRRMAQDPLQVVDTLVQGTQRTLEFARSCRARGVLLLSSGAVYGAQPPELPCLREEYRGAPDLSDPQSAYGEGKRMAEQLGMLFHGRHGLPTKIARCFTFLGPYLPLDEHFAAGNFIRDALAGGPIRISGDGTPRRSYLYAADLAVWLWHILLRGAPGRAYNVGSEAEVTIAELAGLVAEAWHPRPSVELAQRPSGGAPQRYVPSVERAMRELSLRPLVSLRTAIQKTVDWHMQQRALACSTK